MALDSFIPELWASRLLENLNNAHVATQAGVVNRDYEGEIRQKGDTVRIGSIGRITVSDYSRDTDINAPEALNEASQSLLIDQAKYFNFAVDDVDAAQSAVSVMDSAMRESAWGLNDVADTHVLTKMATNAGNAIGSTGSPQAPTVANSLAYELLVDAGVSLAEDNANDDNRFAIVPPWFAGLLKKDDRFTGSGSEASSATLRNGQIGEVDGLRVLRSNNLPKEGAGTSGLYTQIIVGHASATSYAEQINKVEAYRPERRFADAVKGLHVYGAKVVRPDNLVVITADRP